MAGMTERIRSAARVTLASVTVAALSAGVAAEEPRYELYDLGHLGMGGTVAYGMNDNGVVVGASTAPEAKDEVHAFVWDNGEMTDLGTLGGRWAEAYDVNNTNQIVGSAALDDGATRAFYCYDGMMIDLNQLPVSYPQVIVGGLGGMTAECLLPIPEFIDARSISDDGTIVGTGVLFGRERAFMLKMTQRSTPFQPSFHFYDLGVLLVGGSRANDANDFGQVVGQSGEWAFIWDQARGMQLLEPALPNSASKATAVNNWGDVVGEAWDMGSPTLPCAWVVHGRQRLRIGLGLDSGWEGGATDINDFGMVVGYAWTEQDDEHPTGIDAMLWETNRPPVYLSTVTDAFFEDNNEWIALEAATAVDEYGRVVGYGRYSSGRIGAFILVPVEDQED